MDHHKFIVWNKKEESIIIQSVKSRTLPLVSISSIEETNILGWKKRIFSKYIGLD